MPSRSDLMMSLLCPLGARLGCFIGAMQLIKPRKSAKVNIEPLMMAIMSFCSTAEEVIPAVDGCRFDELPSQECPPGQDVRAEQCRRESDGKRVGEEMLDRMGVLRGERYRSRELVVDLVDAGV